MTGHIDPSREQFAAFAKSGVSGPVQMLNLLRFRADAAYADGKAPRGGMTGPEAYREYAKVSAPFFQAVGGKIVWSGKPVGGVIGPVGEDWDAGFIAEYEGIDKFLAMVGDEGYQAIVFHRQAAIADSRLFGFAKTEAGGVFG